MADERWIDVPNATNGLPLVGQPWRHVLYFQSCHGEHAKSGYFHDTAIPLAFILDLLRGDQRFRVWDGTQGTDPPAAFKTGLLCFTYVWERARLGLRTFLQKGTCSEALAAPTAFKIAAGDRHDRLKRTIRKFARVMNSEGFIPPVTLTMRGEVYGPNVSWPDYNVIDLEWHRIGYDDNPDKIRVAMEEMRDGRP